MYEGKMYRVQRLARQSGKFAAQRIGQRAHFRLEALAVKRIADQRVTDRAKMRAHLMRASRLQKTFDQRRDRLLLRAESRKQAPMRHSLSASALWKHGHFGAAGGMAADRRVDRTLRAGRRAPDKREIAALHLAGAAMVGELLGERAMRPVSLGHDHEPARVLVETMHDAWPRHPPDAREALTAMGDQRIDQRAFCVACARVHDKASRLVDDDEVLVLVDNIERHR